MPDDTQTALAMRQQNEVLLDSYCRMRSPGWLVPPAEFETRLLEFLARTPLANER